MTLDKAIDEILRHYGVEEIEQAVDGLAYITVTGSEVEDGNTLPEMKDIPKGAKMYRSDITYLPEDPTKTVDGKVTWYAEGVTPRVPVEVIEMATAFLQQNLAGQERMLDEVYRQVCEGEKGPDGELGLYEKLLLSEKPYALPILNYLADKMAENQPSRARDLRAMLGISGHDVFGLGLLDR